jgi:ubiquitin carboxyl-terminal hydrolase 7
MQHDAQEFERVLIDNLEAKMKGTPLEGRVPALFRGHFRSYVRCKDIDYESEHIEELYDLTMTIRGIPDSITSFKRYVGPEQLTEENQYDIGSHGKQSAEVGMTFVDLPPVLHSHLARHEFNCQYGRLVKIKDKFAFPMTIDLEEFLGLDADRWHPARYDLYGVLVQRGSSYGGHYFAFLRTSTSDEWLKFDDSHVTTATAREAIEDNYGGVGVTNGYMLVYGRQRDAPMVFEPVDESFIPQHLRDYDERNNNGVTLTVVTEDTIRLNCLNGRGGFPCPEHEQTLEFIREDTNQSAYRRVSETLAFPAEEMRGWGGYTQGMPYAVLPNPQTLLTNSYFETLLVQRKTAGELLVLELSRFTDFVKFYHPQIPIPVQYIGVFTITRPDLIASLFPRVAARLGFPVGTTFVIFEELGGGGVKRIPTNSGFPTHGTVGALILQLDPGASLPPTNCRWAAGMPIQAENKKLKEDAAFEGIPVVHDESRAIETVDQFLSGIPEAIVFRFEDPATPVVRIAFGTGLTVPELKRFVARAIGVTYDLAADSLLLFKADRVNPQVPDQTLLSAHHTRELAYQFSATKLYLLFVRFVPGVTEVKLQSLRDLAIDFSEDGYTVLRSTRSYFPTNPKLSEIRDSLVDPHFVPDVPDFRFLAIWSHTIEGIVCEPDAILRAHGSLRVELIPPDQRDLDPSPCSCLGRGSRRLCI